LPMVPFYIFYSIFGLQRVGDMIWACGDMMCRGFLLGGTAGRTTLNGEGLQHQDGHSHILASTVPNLKCYDPAFAYELAVIVQDGIRRMYQNQENIFYYLTVYNENYPMPALPQQDGIAEGILKGGYCFRRGEKNSVKASTKNAGEKIHLLSSGSIMLQAMDAAARLESLGYCVDIWSIPSFIELSREADNCERWNRLNPLEPRRLPYVEQLFAAEGGVFIAVTDYMKAMPNSIAQWMPEHYEVLGTDGYGLSESRPDLRDYFEISDRYIAAAAISSLYRAGKIKQKIMQEQFAGLEIDANKVNPADR
jgi:pyruvate dehydrogenase E1 component